MAILECRRVLEGLIAARAAERITPQDAADLHSIGTSMRMAVAEGELMTYSALNARLHALIAEISSQQTP